MCAQSSLRAEEKRIAVCRYGRCGTFQGKARVVLNGKIVVNVLTKRAVSILIYRIALSGKNQIYVVHEGGTRRPLAEERANTKTNEEEIR